MKSFERDDDNAPTSPKLDALALLAGVVFFAVLKIMGVM
jgi:hypothetical protein